MRKRSICKMQRNIAAFEKDELPYRFLMESFAGWQGYAKWASMFKLRKAMLKCIATAKYQKLEKIKKEGRKPSFERYLFA